MSYFPWVLSASTRIGGDWIMAEAPRLTLPALAHALPFHHSLSVVRLKGASMQSEDTSTDELKFILSSNKKNI